MIVNIKLVRYLAGLQEKKRSFRLEDFPPDFYSMGDLYVLSDMGYLAIHEVTRRFGKKEIDRIDLLRDIRPSDFERPVMNVTSILIRRRYSRSFVLHRPRFL